jgi:DNA recombination protein RmuC
MSETIFALLVLIILALAGVIILVLRRKPEEKGEALLLIQQQISVLNQTLDNKLSESGRVIRDVTEKLAVLGETNKQVVNFAEQLQSLENILKNPKQRGILGEYYLEELLKNVFSPNQYQMQYQFRDGQVVDAVIFLGNNKLIPIDSKFSLENYNRIIEEKEPAKREELERLFRQDLKNRIEETAKYIRPQEDTLDFAFMFIPAEAVYYDLLVNKIGAIKSNTRDLVDYAVREKHVHIVSPTSFYAYLQTILQGLRAMQIEKSAQEIRKRVEMLGKHLAAYEEFLMKLGNNLGGAVSAYNNAYKEFGKVDKNVAQVTGQESVVEPKQLDKPFEE